MAFGIWVSRLEAKREQQWEQMMYWRSGLPFKNKAVLPKTTAGLNLTCFIKSKRTQFSFSLFLFLPATDFLCLWMEQNKTGSCAASLYLSSYAGKCNYVHPNGEYLPENTNCIAVFLFIALITLSKLNVPVCFNSSTPLAWAWLHFRSDNVFCFLSCDSAKWLISMHFSVSGSVLKAFMVLLVFCSHPICPVCSWQHQNNPNRLTERACWVYLCISTYINTKRVNLHTSCGFSLPFPLKLHFHSQERNKLRCCSNFCL